mmetsp:Transcript_19886/g.29789  ORF Transcript_19886/g.29789 Transcript_19886/m.29789 type:complete len:104 (+) Transcript_19886:256-567(+)|eukprot:CAMPEP_0194759956 /NCGR_PEP_ID=MMETSP0323_2-20130528/12926_1 /TAXON_ID=2866 ORGANISM="Crypthecodinium cohnii, Strain Seligo" /NCGR_SAMPLE_ID=MMETSP0323_2 /ASSEMBLY_ACC=CAM_ASM_000346 /LENGTH=103 /DNA_ID=CAMNT_0039680953 /DNA_START=324 /DNA_END=635 /DNA_ORIENTATION=+
MSRRSSLMCSAVGALAILVLFFLPALGLEQECFGLADCGSGADEDPLGDETVLLQTYKVVHKKRGKRVTGAKASSPPKAVQHPEVDLEVGEANSLDEDSVSMR